MTMYVVAGDGEMPSADLKATLDDQEAAAIQEERQFWMLVRASAEPTATDRALMAWVREHETYFETYGPDASKADEIYAGTQEKHPVKGIAAKLVELLDSKPEEGEDAMLLALFASDDPDAPEDAELMTVVEAVLNAGFPVFAFNDGMAPITLVEGEGGEDDAEDGDETTEELPVDEDAGLTREALEAMDKEDVKKIAAQRGLTFPPRTHIGTYITAILERGVDAGGSEVEIEEVAGGKEPAEMEEVAATNGHVTDSSADSYARVKELLRALGQALIDATN